ncbi:MAG: hypothetical protein K2N32_03120, partial [Clostridia bacterium]|nr:hypothetical protein [Clostridia bacterium]
MSGKKIALICAICIALTVGGALGIYALSVNFAPMTITLDTSRTYQTMNGFGASSAWIYQDLGNVEDSEFKNKAINMLYGSEGLGLNTFRYNIGAGGVESDKYEDPLRGAESFFIADRFDGDYSVFADSSNYDFSRDQAVRDMFERALAPGNIRQIVFFANSPHYLMTKNGKTHGENEYDNNLKEECYEAFCDYLFVIVGYLYENVVSKYDENIKIFISPVNEPQWKWGGDDASQEGCHYDPKVLAKFYDVFYSKLTAYNQEKSTDFVMDIFESGNYKMIKTSRTKFNEYMTEFEKYPYFDELEHISLHSYGADTSKYYRSTFADYMAKYYPQMKISMSEYCTLIDTLDPSIDMGLHCGKVIIRDLAMLNVTDWNYWLSISKGVYEDGLVYWQKDNEKDVLNVYKRYYVMGQFSKYIGEGSVRIKASYSDFLQFNGVESVAFANADGSITLIVLNDSNSEREIKIKGAYANVKEIVTNADENWKISEYENAGKVKVSAKSVT